MLALGVLCINFAFAFTALNLPLDDIETSPVKPLQMNDNTQLVYEVQMPDNIQLRNMYDENTILIDMSLESKVIPFPHASRDCILDQVPYPDFAKQQQLEGGVTVRFAFDNSGNIQVKDASSTSEEFEEYVTYKLQNLRLKNCVVDSNKDYYLRFMFRLF